MKIGFTGTREGMTREQKRRLVILLLRLNPVELHHGCCVGSDEQANTIAREVLGLYTVGHPPTFSSYLSLDCLYVLDEQRSPKPYVDRDHNIVDETDYLIATPKTSVEQLRSGTWLTVRYAVKQGKKVYLILPDGRLENM